MASGLRTEHATRCVVAVLLCTALVLQVSAAGRPTSSVARSLLQQRVVITGSSSSSSGSISFYIPNGAGISNVGGRGTSGKKETCLTLYNNCKSTLYVSLGWISTDNGAEYYKGYFEYKKGEKDKVCLNSVDPKDGFYVHVDDEGPTTVQSVWRPAGVTAGTDGKLEREGCMFVPNAYTTAYNSQLNQYGSIDEKTGAYTPTDKCFLAWFWHVGIPSGEVKLCDI